MVRAGDKRNNVISTVSAKEFCEMVADEVYTIYGRKSISRRDCFAAFVSAFVGYVKQCRATGLCSVEVIDWLNSANPYHARFVHKHFFMKLKGFRSTRQIIQYVLTEKLNSLLEKDCETYLTIYQEIISCKNMR